MIKNSSKKPKDIDIVAKHLTVINDTVQKLDTKFGKLETRIDNLETNINKRFDDVDFRLNKIEFNHERRIELLEDDMRQIKVKVLRK